MKAAIATVVASRAVKSAAAIRLTAFDAWRSLTIPCCALLLSPTKNAASMKAVNERKKPMAVFKSQLGIASSQSGEKGDLNLVSENSLQNVIAETGEQQTSVLFCIVDRGISSA